MDLFEWTLALLPAAVALTALSRRAIGGEGLHRLSEDLDGRELAASPAGRFQPLTT